MANPPQNNPAPRTDPRASTRQILVVALLGGILLVSLGILVVLLLGLPGRFSPAPHAAAQQSLPQVVQPSSPAPARPVVASTVPPVPTESPRTSQPNNERQSAGLGSEFLPRSPIPEPGEVVTAAIPPRRLDGTQTGKTGAPSAPQEVVPWNTAARYVGKEITIEGKVVQTRRSGKVCFLNFSHDRDAFYLIMFEKTLKSWPEAPEDYFKGKTIRAKGKVEMHDERPELKIEDAAQIVVME